MLSIAIILQTKNAIQSPVECYWKRVPILYEVITWHRHFFSPKKFQNHYHVVHFTQSASLLSRDFFFTVFWVSYEIVWSIGVGAEFHELQSYFIVSINDKTHRGKYDFKNYGIIQQTIALKWVNFSWRRLAKYNCFLRSETNPEPFTVI